MPSLRDVLCLVALFLEWVLHAQSVPCRGSATYKLQFQGEWKNTTSRPAGASFTGLIGAGHNKCYKMWEPGERASLGVKNVAEKGDSTELSKEIQKHIEKWKTVTERIKPLKTNTIGPMAQVFLPETELPGSIYTLDKFHPLVSVVVRVEPSPDWFVGVYDVSLCNKSGGWIQEKIIRLFPYDAGTAVRSQYNDSLVVPSNPGQKIALVQERDISDRGMGYIRINFKGGSQDFKPPYVIDEDNCPNTASIREISLLVWSALICMLLWVKL